MISMQYLDHLPRSSASCRQQIVGDLNKLNGCCEIEALAQPAFGHELAIRRSCLPSLAPSRCPLCIVSSSLTGSGGRSVRSAGMVFRTGPRALSRAEFLPQHYQQRQQVIQIISATEARGQQRLAQMNRQVLGNLDQIITVLETPADTGGTGAADAR